MANNRRYTNQFMNSFERQPVMVMGAVSQSGSAGTAAVLVSNGITYTAIRFGTAGNSITIALVSGGTAGAEVVSVVNKAISVQIQSGTSTRTQVKTALDASLAASALISTSVASGATAATLSAAAPLATGTDASLSSNSNAISVAQTNTGAYEITSRAGFSNLLSASVMLQRSSGAVDLVAQVASVDSANQIVNIRMLTGATPTDMASGDILYIQLVLRPSANPS